MLKNYTYYLLLCLLIILSSCQSSTEEAVFYTEPPEEKLDKYCAYLGKEQNFQDSSYMQFFRKRFDVLIKQNKIDSAAQVLFIAGKTIKNNYKFDADFIQESISFVEKYKTKVPERYFSGIYSNIGDTFCDVGKFDSCTYYLQKSIIKPTDFYTYQSVADAHYRLLFGYLNNGKLEQSLSTGLKALEMFENQKDIRFQAASYSGIACIYRFQEDYPEAEAYENRGYELVKQSQDTSAMLTVSMNKITLYNDMGHPNLFPFIDSTLVLFEKYKGKSDDEKLSVKSWYAFKLIGQNRLLEAKKILDEIKPLLSKIDNEVTKDYFYNAFSEYEVKRGQGSENIAFYRQKISELTENQDYLRLELYNQILHDDAVLKKNYQAALKYSQQIQIANDSLNNKMLRVKVKELDKKYQTEKKEQQIQIQRQEITQKNTYIALLVASLSGLLLAVFAYYSWQKQKLLRQEKTNSMNFTKQLLENTEDERKRIASDLHDSISHELLNLKSIFSQDLSVVNKKIDTIINDIRGISRNLHPVMFDKIGLVPNVEQLVERIQNQNNFFISTDIVYTGLLTSADELQIYRIIQEALTNIIKYAKAHAAKITISEESDKIAIEIRDNGKGFDVKQALNSGKAFGLHNIIERSRVIGGEANISSSSEGTVITINIPKKL